MENLVCSSKFHVLDDLITTVKVAKAVKEARKQGATGVKVQPVKTVSLVDIDYWSWIPEALLPYPNIPSGTREAVKAVFNAFDEETQHRMTFGPGCNPAELLERAKFWQEALRPSLTREQYSAAILTILDWCIYCAKKSNRAVKAAESA